MKIVSGNNIASKTKFSFSIVKTKEKKICSENYMAVSEAKLIGSSRCA